MKKILRVLAIIVLVAATCWSRGGTASAANDPFTCTSDFYQVISGQLKVLNPQTGAYSDIGSNAGFNYNAIGYNVEDDYIYGIVNNGADLGDLIRVGSDGTTTNLGLPTGLPVSGHFNGSFDLAGNLYIRTGTTTIYKIDVSAMTATALTITGDSVLGSGDNVFINNKLYLLNGTTLVVVDLGTLVATNTTVTGPSGWDVGGGYGAGWSTDADELFFSNNASGSIYQIMDYDTPTPTAVFKVAGTVTSNNDGSNCPVAAQNPFDPPEANDDSFTTPFNTQLVETTNPILDNDLGNGLTVTSNTNPAHGTVTVNADGTFTYTPDTDFSGTDSFDYTVTDSFDRTASATVTITINALMPTAPDTGHGAPRESSRIVPVIGLASFVSLGIGLWLLYRQKQTIRRGYKIA